MPTSADDFHAFLRTRRSIRRFKPDPLADEVVTRVLATAIHAPSAHNTQPWRFAVVGRNGIPPKEERIANPLHNTRTRLAHALTSSMRADMTAEGAPEPEIEKRVATSIRRINEAPVIILLCRDVTAVREHKREDEIMAIQSVANAATYLLLAAHAEGLGGNWICWPLYAQEESRQALDLPETWEPQAMVFLGYPNETPGSKAQKNLEQVIKTV
ncbi:MAG: nitroreductase family protein [Chloroflexi bacterium]|nr:nitroreductase family protein [Chloroflexota bacterium]